MVAALPWEVALLSACAQLSRGQNLTGLVSGKGAAGRIDEKVHDATLRNCLTCVGRRR